MMFRRRSLAPLLVCLAQVRVAQAEPPPAELSSAKLAFESALSLEATQHWAEAALKLREAVAVKDTPGLRFHLAHCEIEQGHLLEATSEYERAGELVRQGAKAPDVQKLLGPASEALKRRIPRFTLQFPADVSQKLASVDGKVYPPSELELGLPLNPGRHEVRVTASGRRSFERSVLLAEAEQLSIQVDLPLVVAAPLGRTAGGAPLAALAPSSAPPRAAASSEHSSVTRSASAKPYLLIGESALTAIGLAIGIGYQLALTSANDRVADAQGRIDGVAPGDGTACGSRPELAGACADLQTAIDDHDRAARLSNIGFITAGVGAAALVTTWLAYPSARSQASRLTLEPLAGFGRLGLLGHF